MKEVRRIQTKTDKTYPWSFVTQILHNGEPSHGGDWKTYAMITPT